MSVFPGQTVVPFGSGYDRLAITAGDERLLVERSALTQIRTHLEQECQRQETIWAQRNADLSAQLPLVLPAARIDRVAPQNFFEGARPSLLQSSIDFWPSVTCRAALAQAASEQIDQLDVLSVRLDVEVLCKSQQVAQDRLHEQEGIDAEGYVNQQVQMLSAAVHMCLRLDPTIGGRFEPLERPPTKRQGFPFAVAGNNRERAGAYHLYCGCQMQYTVRVNSY
jgi:hypothetical protein